LWRWAVVVFFFFDNFDFLVLVFVVLLLFLLFCCDGKEPSEGEYNLTTRKSRQATNTHEVDVHLPSSCS
jgi:hypothetical protein